MRKYVVTNILDKLLRLIGVLGTHNASVSNVKECLALLKVPTPTKITLVSYPHCANSPLTQT